MTRIRFDRRRPGPPSPVVDAAELLDVTGPEAIEVHARALTVGAHLATTLVVTGYPAEVTPGWLAPLLNFPAHLDIAPHIEPVPNPIAESLLMTVAPTTYRALPGWLATLPLGIDTLKIRRTFDTAALAACFPFTSPDLPAATGEDGTASGVLYGLNAVSGAPVLWDR